MLCCQDQQSTRLCALYLICGKDYLKTFQPFGCLPTIIRREVLDQKCFSALEVKCDRNKKGAANSYSRRLCLCMYAL